MATINLIREDIKKDLTNFLVAISEAGVSDAFFGNFADLVTKSTSGTINVDQFFDEFINLLKEEKTIKDQNNVNDFAPIVTAEKRRSEVTHTAQGDSNSVPGYGQKNTDTKIDLEVEHPVLKTIEDQSEITRGKEDGEVERFRQVSSDELEIVRTEEIRNETDLDVGRNVNDPTEEQTITYRTISGETTSVGGIPNDNPKVGIPIDLEVVADMGNKINELINAAQESLFEAKEEQDLSFDVSTDVDVDGDDIDNQVITIVDKTEEDIDNQIITDSDNKIAIPFAVQEAVQTIVDRASLSESDRKRIDYLIFNAIPYRVLGSLTGLIGGIAPGFDISNPTFDLIEIIDTVTGTLSAIGDFINQAKYFSLVEMGYFSVGLANFYTLPYFRGRTVKDLRKIWPLNNFDVNFVEPRFFGQPKFMSYATSGSSFLQSLIDEGLATIGGILEGLADTVTGGLYSQITTAIEDVSGFITTFVGQPGPPEYNLASLHSYALTSDLAGAFGLVGADLISFLNGIFSVLGVTSPLGLSGHGISITAAKLARSPVLGNVAGAILRSSLQAWLIQIDRDSPSNQVQYNLPSLHKDPNSTKSEGEVSIGLSDLSAFRTEDGYNPSSDPAALTAKEGIWDIGSIYIWPVGDGEIDPKSKYIPFQFNPAINEGGVSARYQATQILSRIGNLQSFTGVNSLNVVIEAEYFALSNESNVNFNMVSIQSIEMAYRSLSLPWYSGDDIEQYKYFKPPILKVIMGNKNTIDEVGDAGGSEVFSNLLTYPDNILGEKLKLGGSHNLRHFRSFVATSVTITKDTKNTPFYMELDSSNNPLIRDTLGFKVNLNLVEVTPSYFLALPNFKDYYSNSYSKGNVRSS